MDKEEQLVTSAAPAGFYDQKKEKEPRPPMSRNTKLALGGLGLVALLAVLAVVIAAPWVDDPIPPGPFVCRKQTVKADIIFIADGTRLEPVLEDQRDAIRNFTRIMNIGPSNTRVAYYEMSRNTISPTVLLNETVDFDTWNSKLNMIDYKGGLTDMAGALTFAQDLFLDPYNSRDDVEVRYVIFFAGGPATAPICYDESLHPGGSGFRCTGNNSPNASCSVVDAGVFDTGAAGCVNDFFPLFGASAAVQALEFLKTNVTTNFWFISTGVFDDPTFLGNVTGDEIFGEDDFATTASGEANLTSALINEFNLQCE